MWYFDFFRQQKQVFGTKQEKIYILSKVNLIHISEILIFY